MQSTCYYWMRGRCTKEDKCSHLHFYRIGVRIPHDEQNGMKIVDDIFSTISFQTFAIEKCTSDALFDIIWIDINDDCDKDYLIEIQTKVSASTYGDSNISVLLPRGIYSTSKKRKSRSNYEPIQLSVSSAVNEDNQHIKIEYLFSIIKEMSSQLQKINEKVDKLLQIYS